MDSTEALVLTYFVLGCVCLAMMLDAYRVWRNK